MSPFTCRPARMDDVEAIRTLMHRAIEQLQSGFLTPAEIRASHLVMGLDTQLVQDGTYLLVLDGDVIAGCGGWSYRATLYGGDDSIVEREAAIVDPTIEPARIRAMYTSPQHVRRGVGRLVLERCEAAARAAGFTRAEMMATLAGEPLYRACGYSPIERVLSAPIDDVRIPLIRMGKSIVSSDQST